MPLKNRGRSLAVFASLLSAALLIAAFPRIDWTWCVWVGLVPLLLSIAQASYRMGFLLAYACGIVFFCGVFNWSFEIPGYGIRHQAILAVYLGLYFAIFGLIFAFLANRLTVNHAYLSAPVIWTCLEYVRVNLPILALPWPLLSHSQYQHLPVIQIASFTGAYGVSFSIVLVNATLAAALHPILFGDTRDANAGKWFVDRRFRLLAGTCVLSIACMLAYGHWSLQQPLPERQVKLSVLQGNIDQEKKRDPRKHAAFIMQRYAALSEKAGREGPDLIIWPEASTPGLILKHMGLYNQLRKLIRRLDTHFLIGSSEFPKFQLLDTNSQQAGNTALFISPQGKVLGQYLKIRLLPFGEYIPFEKTIAWPRFIIDAKRNWDMPGEEAVLFELAGARFGVIICWENAFPTLFRRFVNNGAQFMINITNEGWFGESAAPYQFLAMSVFRAVENRVSLSRAANTGVSCFIDPNGRIVDRIKTRGKDIYVDGFLTRQISISDKKSFYTRYGDVFVIINMLFLLCFLFLALKNSRG